MTLTAEQTQVVADLLGWVLDQAHDTFERDYIQGVVDAGADVWAPSEDRESELEGIVAGALEAIVRGETQS